MRVLFTVALTVAVAGVVFPAVETVGVDRATTQTGGAVERLVAAARTLADGNDAMTADRGAARRVLTVTLPTDGVASAPLAGLSVGPPETDVSSDPVATRVGWRVAGGERQTRQFDGVRLRPASGERFTLRTGGTHRLVLRLVRRDGRRVVTVSRYRPRGPAVRPAVRTPAGRQSPNVQVPRRDHRGPCTDCSRG